MTSGRSPVWLQAEGLTKRYSRGKVALRGATVAFGAGVTAVVGPNGAGKTTLLRLLAGVLAPSAGAVVWCGRPVARDPVGYRDVIGYLPQDFEPYPEMTPVGFLGYVAALKGVPSGLIPARVEELLGLVGLGGGEGGRRSSELSHGQSRRLGLAQALLNDPQVLLLDEPTSGIDLEGKLGVLELIRRLATGKAVVFSTHILTDAGQVADAVLCLDEGVPSPALGREVFLAEAQGCVYEGKVSAAEIERLKNEPSVVVVAQAPVGEGRYRVRAASLSDPGRGLSPARPDFEDAYVVRRLRARAGSRTW